MKVCVLPRDDTVIVEVCTQLCIYSLVKLLRNQNVNVYVLMAVKCYKIT